MKDILSKLKNNEPLTESDNKILFEVIKEHNDCNKYYSQNFVGMWDCDKVNPNWRAKKATNYIESKIKEIKEENTLVIDIEVPDVQA